MSDTPYVVQEVRWFQFRAPDGHAFFVLCASLPNGFWTAVPYEIAMTPADHACMALAGTVEEALAQLQQTLAGKRHEEIFPGAHATP